MAFEFSLDHFSCEFGCGADWSRLTARLKVVINSQLKIKL